jgi:hypothetical protein
MGSPRLLSTGALAVLLSLPSAIFCAAGDAPPNVPIFKRIAVVGASVSGGFGLPAEVGAPVVLGDALHAAVRGGHDPVLSAAESLFFLSPTAAAENTMTKVLPRQPTLVVAVDFLFWFGYGRVAREEERLGRLETGLAYLDRFSCPCVVGDIPDMSAAVGKMLAASQVPKKETLRRLNQRIRQWAKQRKRMVMIDLAALMETLRTGKEARLGEYRGTRKTLLQRDQLHTTLEGTAYLAVFSLEAVRRARKDVPKTAFTNDPRAVAEAVRAAVKERSDRAGEKESKKKEKRGQPN